MNIQTKRLELKALREKDHDRMIYLLTCQDIKKTYMLPDFESKKEVSTFFRKIKEISLDDCLYFVGIFFHDQVIGFMNEVERKDRCIELGYVIDPVFQNKGFASEALNGMIHKMFDLGFKEVVCGAFDDNDASIRVMEKCGMVKMNRFDEIEYQGKFHHCVYYSKVNE